MRKTKSFLVAFIMSVSFLSGAQSRIIEYEKPKVTVFLPPEGMENGAAIVDCPGGGYSRVAIQHEGYFWAPFFNNLGYAYAVVDYKMPDGNPNIPLKDVEDTFILLKENADEWKISSDKIGIMGFSAGGHLASSVATHANENCRPAFQILFYPVISMKTGITHEGSKLGLLGQNVSEEQIREWSSENNVTPETCPAFIALSSDDAGVSPLNSVNYYLALVKNNVPVELISYPTGGHGWGFHKYVGFHDILLKQLADWLDVYGK